MTIVGLWAYINRHGLQRELNEATLIGKTVAVDASIWCACRFSRATRPVLTLAEQAPSWTAREQVPSRAERPQIMVRA